jgi:hypothetical protein
MNKTATLYDHRAFHGAPGAGMHGSIILNL